MRREFQVIYQEQSRLTLGEAAGHPDAAKMIKGMQTPEFFPHGPAQTINVVASKKEDVRKLLPNVHILSIEQIRIVLDPNQQWFRPEEAAEYLGCGVSTIYDKYVAEGKLPKAKDGNPIYSRRQLDAVAADKMTKIDFPKGLKQAA
jgi:excisionase family DNA binding protein